MFVKLITGKAHPGAITVLAVKSATINTAKVKNISTPKTILSTRHLHHKSVCFPLSILTIQIYIPGAQKTITGLITVRQAFRRFLNLGIKTFFLQHIRASIILSA